MSDKWEGQRSWFTLNIINAIWCCLISLSESHPSSCQISAECFEYEAPVGVGLLGLFTAVHYYVGLCRAMQGYHVPLCRNMSGYWVCCIEGVNSCIAWELTWNHYMVVTSRTYQFSFSNRWPFNLGFWAICFWCDQFVFNVSKLYLM